MFKKERNKENRKEPRLVFVNDFIFQNFNAFTS